MRLTYSLVLLLSLLIPSAAAARAEVTVDADFPGGNGVVRMIDGDHVYLYPDLRDTQGPWFYWCVRVRGAAGRTLTFHLTRYDPVGVRGPAVSTDAGKTWRWLGKQSGDARSLRYTFGADAADVRFGLGMMYTSASLERFLKTLPAGAPVRREALCKSRAGREVPMLRVAKVEGDPRYRVLFTARHHACEMMASYAIEGVIDGVLADDEAGKWLRANVELLVIPIVDFDGVERGDQGKNRKPRDHNRDYVGDSIYPETAAIRKLVPAWSGGKLVAAFDLHCPWIRGNFNEVIYQVGSGVPAVWAEQQRFGAILECARRGPLVYRAADDLPFNTAWNTAANYRLGVSNSRWAATLPGVRLAGGFEIPYANAAGVEVTADTARAFGRDIAAGLKAYLESLPDAPAAK